MTYIIQIDDETREATTNEIAVIEALQAEEANRKDEEAAKVIEKAAILAKLGITEDEANLLLG
jgi:hypothetical protein